VHEADAEPEEQRADDRARPELPPGDAQARPSQEEDGREEEGGHGGMVSIAILIPRYVEPQTK